MKEKIRPIYSEFQGFLKELPGESGAYSAIRQEGIWSSYHESIKDLNGITGKNYDKFKVDIKVAGAGFSTPHYISLVEFKIKLGGLISRLYAEFFSNEKNPLDGSPSTMINNSQSQNQNLQVEIALEISDLISNKINNLEKGSKERSFLEQVKEGLKSGKGAVDLVNLILTTASKSGLAIDEIMKLFS